MTRTLDKSWTKKDFKIDWFSGTGAGGQHRNKHQNCVRITHLESGITTTGQNYRERTRNFDEAFRELSKRVVAWHYGEQNKPRFKETSVVRTYNEAENRVTDHETDIKSTLKDFDLDVIIQERLSKCNRVFEHD